MRSSEILWISSLIFHLVKVTLSPSYYRLSWVPLCKCVYQTCEDICRYLHGLPAHIAQDIFHIPYLYLTVPLLWLYENVAHLKWIYISRCLSICHMDYASWTFSQIWVRYWLLICHLHYFKVSRFKCSLEMNLMIRRDRPPPASHQRRVRDFILGATTYWAWRRHTALALLYYFASAFLSSAFHFSFAGYRAIVVAIKFYQVIPPPRKHAILGHAMPQLLKLLTSLYFIDIELISRVINRLLGYLRLVIGWLCILC